MLVNIVEVGFVLPEISRYWIGQKLMASGLTPRRGARNSKYYRLKDVIETLRKGNKLKKVPEQELYDRFKKHFPTRFDDWRVTL